MRLFDTGEDLAMAARVGPRPRTRLALPHVQLDQWPPAEIAREFIERALSNPGVRAKHSRMASPASLALCLPDDFADGPRDAFYDDHEFCLLHPLPEAGIHLTLPRAVRDNVIKLGWAELHPGARAGIMPETLVMLYAPRNGVELDIASHLIRTSSQFAMGVWNTLPPGGANGRGYEQSDRRVPL